jgi:hypothetical protein
MVRDKCSLICFGLVFVFGAFFWSLVAKLADFSGELAVLKPPAKLPDSISSKRMNIKAKSMERKGKRGLPTSELHT